MYKQIKRKIHHYINYFLYIILSCRLLKNIIKKAFFISENYNQKNSNDNGEYFILKNAIKDCSVFFDVGANIGEWSNKILSFNKNVNIYLFEPSLESFNVCKKLEGNITINQTGIGEKKEKKLFKIFNELSPENSFFIHSGRNLLVKKEVEVSITTIDDYCEENNITKIDFIKLDIEGSELAALRGMRKMLKNKAIKYIQFEYTDTWIGSKTLLKEVFEFLYDYEYEIYKIIPKGLKKILKYNNNLENYYYINYLIVKNGEKIF